MLFLLVTAPSWGIEPVDKIIARALAINPGLLDYSADIQLPLRATLGFIPYNKNMNGRYYHKRPDKHKLDLQNAPGILKKYPNVFGFNLPDMARYKVLKVQPMNLRGTIPVYKIIMIPKVRTSDITGIDIYVNRSDYTIPKYDTFYVKGHLYVNIDFRKQGKYLVYDKMSADFEFPNVLATASATYSNYQFNQNLQDSFFH